MIREIKIEKLEQDCLDLLSKTYIQLGQHNIEAEQKVIMAQSLAEDLKRSYKNFYWKDVLEAFRIGLREPNETFIHINVPTYIKWLRMHQERIWNDIYKAEQLGHDLKNLPYYRKPKLLK